MKLHVHLHERLLHVLNVGGGVIDQAFSMAQVRAQTDHAVAGTEAAPQQAVLVELLQPLRIGHVRLAAGDILDVTRIHQKHFEAVRFEDLEGRNPVHACRLHGDCLDADLLEPVSQLMEVAAEGPERSHRPFISVGRHGDHVKVAPISIPAASGLIVNSRPADFTRVVLLPGITHPPVSEPREQGWRLRSLS